MLYKLLLVDDEQIEREGISNLIGWASYDIDFLGAAKNGVEAYDTILKQKPDIVITDIKMPIVSGIDLIEKVSKILPDTIFVVLSGYGDYEFTSKAMLFGVKHYLLKPVSEENILKALEGVKDELQERLEKRQKMNNLAGKLERVLPYVKEQFLCGCALTGTYSEQDSRYFKSLFGITYRQFMIAVLLPEKPCDFIRKYALRNIAEETIGWQTVALSAIIEEKVVLVFKAMDLMEVQNRMRNVQKYYNKYFQISFSAAVSDTGCFENIHKLYQQACDLLKFRYDLPEYAVISSKLIKSENKNNAEIVSEIDSIYNAVKTGAIDELNYKLEILFNRFRRENTKEKSVMNYCRGLLHSVVMLNNDNGMQAKHSEMVMDPDQLHSVSDYYDEVKTVCNKIVETNDKSNQKKKNPIVESMLKIIYENISNPELSLKWIAHNRLYMNEEYLGRLFYRDMKEKFSKFLIKTHIEMAKKLFENTSGLKIHEVSQMTGFSDDAQYFGKVFKSLTGMTPLEYQKKAKRF